MFKLASNPAMKIWMKLKLVKLFQIYKVLAICQRIDCENPMENLSTTLKRDLDSWEKFVVNLLLWILLQIWKMAVCRDFLACFPWKVVLSIQALIWNGEISCGNLKIRIPTKALSKKFESTGLRSLFESQRRKFDSRNFNEIVQKCWKFLDFWTVGTKATYQCLKFVVNPSLLSLRRTSSDWFARNSIGVGNF